MDETGITHIDSIQGFFTFLHILWKPIKGYLGGNLSQRKRDNEFAGKNASEAVTIGFSLGKELKKKRPGSEEEMLVWEKSDDPGLKDHLFCNKRRVQVK